jgi:hypothetical protein
MLLAGTKPAGLWEGDLTCEQADELRTAGLLVIEVFLDPRELQANQLQLDLGPAGRRRADLTFAARSDLKRVTEASSAGTAAQLGHALGYSEDDIRDWYVRAREA